VKRGDTLTFKGKLLLDSSGYGGQVVQIYMDNVFVTSKTTSSDGSYSVDWPVPLKWPLTDGVPLGCKSHSIFAQHYATGKTSATQTVKIARVTSITNLLAPDTVSVGQAFMVSGYLKYEDDTGASVPLAGKTVNLSYNGTSLGSATTDSNGYFHKDDCKISTSGTKTLTATFAGEGLTSLAVRSRTLEVLPIQAVAIGLPLAAGVALLAISLRRR
jgi:hypothetical protein